MSLCPNKFFFFPQMSSSYASLIDALDLFYPIADWPYYMKNIILCERPTYSNRVKVASFFFGNGASKYTAIRIYLYYNHYRRQIDVRRFDELYDFLNQLILNNDQRVLEYYYFDIDAKNFLFINGRYRGFRNRQFDHFSRRLDSQGRPLC